VDSCLCEEELDRVLGTALIDMYAKCGCIDNAMQVFEEMPIRDVFAYTSMISGLLNHRRCEMAKVLFDEWKRKVFDRMRLLLSVRLAHAAGLV